MSDCVELFLFNVIKFYMKLYPIILVSELIKTYDRSIKLGWQSRYIYVSKVRESWVADHKVEGMESWIQEALCWEHAQWLIEHGIVFGIPLFGNDLVHSYAPLVSLTTYIPLLCLLFCKQWMTKHHTPFSCAFWMWPKFCNPWLIRGHLIASQGLQ